MHLKEVLHLTKTRTLNINIGDTYNTIVDLLGEPESLFEQKKYKIKVIQYKEIELTFVNKKLHSYAYLFFEDQNSLSFEEFEKLFDCSFVKESHGDFFVVKVSDDVQFVFSEEHYNLFKIMIR